MAARMDEAVGNAALFLNRTYADFSDEESVKNYFAVLDLIQQENLHRLDQPTK